MEEKRPAIEWAARLLCLALLLLGGYLFVKYLLGILLPFLIGAALALGLRRPAVALKKGTRIPCPALRLILALSLFFCIGVGVWLLGARLIRELQRLVLALEAGDPAFATRWQALLDRLPAPLKGEGGYLTQVTQNALGALSSYLPKLLTAIVSGVPRVVLFLVMTLLSTIYFCLDLEGIGSAVSRVLPQKYRLRLVKLKSGACQVGVKYLKSYLCLMGVTFALSLMGLLFLRVDYALLLAFLISLVDLFPILGVGTILVPWGVWCLTLGGSPFLGIGLLVLWGVCSLTRQFLEPRLLGDSLGVHPLLTLFAMYLGLRLAGVAGMLLLPALCVPLTSFLRGRSEGEEKTA
jgi:sporulation integral membrane protein YtvI